MLIKFIFYHFIFFIITNTSYAVTLEYFSENNRHSEIIQYSISKINFPLNYNHKIHLRNAGRGSINIGDYQSANFFFKLSNSIRKENDENILLGYVGLLSHDYNVWLNSERHFNNKNKYKLIELIDGKNRNSEISFGEVKKITKDIKNEKLVKAINNYTNTPLKSGFTASSLNLLIPGSGFVYLGMYETALTSFLLTTVSIFATLELYDRGLDNTAFAGLLVSSIFYFGGAMEGSVSANNINEKGTIRNRKILREWSIPILKYEF